MTQSDIVIGHRLTARLDVDALGQLTQSYMRQGLEQEIGPSASSERRSRLFLMMPMNASFRSSSARASPGTAAVLRPPSLRRKNIF